MRKLLNVNKGAVDDCYTDASAAADAADASAVPTASLSDLDDDDDDFNNDDFNPADVPPSLLSQQQKKKSKKKCSAFEKLGIELQFISVIHKLGYKLPTPIQRAAIPVILTGRDVVAMARTGSGKTAAFCLPVLQKLRSHSSSVGIRCVILEPTRDLAFQVAKVMRQICCFTDLRVCVVVGGAAMEAQFESLANNPDIVVAAPGRLIHHMVESGLTLSAVQILIMDETDQLFERGMAEQLSQILRSVSPKRQCIMTSATLPLQLYDFSKAGLRDPEFIRLNVDDSISDNLDLWFLYSRTEEKIPCLLFLLREILNASEYNSVANYDTDESRHRNIKRFKNKPSHHQRQNHHQDTISVPTVSGPLPPGVIVFVASRYHVDFLGVLLSKSSIRVSLVYGSMDHEARVETLERFASGQTKVLVVTDVAARGLDIPVVGTVINFDFPTSPKHFLHRVGRTARAGRSGLSISLISLRELPYVVEVLLFTNLKIELPVGVAVNQTKDCFSVMSSIVSCASSSSPSVAAAAAPGVTIETDLSALDRNSQQAQRRKPLHMGAVPDVSADVELLRQYLQSDSELALLYKSMQNSYIQYNKVRRPASKQSVRRAKQLIIDAGGVAKLFSLIHPALKEIAEKRGMGSNFNTEREDFLEQIRNVKPKDTANRFSSKSSNKSGVLPVDVVDRMTKKLELSNMKYLPAEDAAEAETAATSDSDAESEAGAEQKLKSCSGFDVFDWQAHATRRSGFFLSVDKNSVDAIGEFRESHFGVNANNSRSASQTFSEMNKATFNLIPDDDSNLKKAKHVRKWDARRKRYIIMPVDNEGRALRMKEQKKRNEAGVLVTGELKKTGVYDKWVRLTKRRIQRVGEEESLEAFEEAAKRRVNSSKFKSAAAAGVAGTRKSKDDDDEEPELPPLSSLSKDKGLIEAIETGAAMTAKQKRKAKKLLNMQKAVVTVGSKGGEVKTLQQIAKTKKLIMKNKIMQNRKLREQYTRKSKEKHMRKRERQNQMKSRRPRSFALVTGKNRNKQQQQQQQHKNRRR